MWNRRRILRERATLSSSSSFPYRTSSVAFSLSAATRSFYSGLDDNRVHRLRRSGMTFNKPRGRDTLSMAFESRIRVLPLNTIGDLYGPVNPPSHTLDLHRADSLPGPRESNEAEDRDRSGPATNGEVASQSASGASRTREKEKEEETNEWQVLVVEPLGSWQVELPVPFPSSHPALYADWTAAAAGGGAPADSVLDRRPLSKHLLNPHEQGELLRLSGEPAVEAAAPFSSSASTSSPLLVQTQNETFFHYAAANRRHLRQNGDTTLFPSSFSARFPLPLPDDNGTAGATATEKPQCHSQVRFFLSMVVDPFIDLERFRREEAQVELISGYRNLFYEACELPNLGATSSSSSASMSRLSSTSTPRSRRVADVVRIPALSVYSCGPRFFHEMGKLNQQSIIKGFHRISNEAKEQLILNKNFTVELYVPPLLLGQFENAFEEEAWEIPQSTLNPGRTALYPGLAPPRTLLSYDGWIGKRPELVEAIETEGKSLLRGKKFGIDGQEIHEQEVLSHIRVFGAKEEEATRLARERETAAREDSLLESEALATEGVAALSSCGELHPGLLQERGPQERMSGKGVTED